MINEAVYKEIKTGSKVRVFEEGSSSAFEGLVIARRHGEEAGGTFTVRSVRAGVSVEKVFPLRSPRVTKLEIVSSPKKIHKSKLYFIRDFSGAKIRQRLKVSL